MQTLRLIHFYCQLLRRLLSALICKQLFLIRIVDGDVLQRQRFSIHNMVHGTQHLQNAFKGHSHDAFHTCDKVLCIVCGHICPESQLPQLLIRFRDLPGGTNHNFRLFGIDDPVVVKMWRCDIPHMGIHRKNLLPANGHGITGQVCL